MPGKNTCSRSMARQSIENKALLEALMDARVKPGHDE
jgi:hypothetical protein